MGQYLITGGAGFIGSHLASALVERGDRVRILDDLSSGRTDNLAHLDVGDLGSGSPVELLRGDITSAADCLAATEGVEGVFHEAAQVSVPDSLRDPERSYQVNVMGTLRVLEAMRSNGARKIVFAASSAAYGNSNEVPKVETMPADPVSPYAGGKVAAENLLRIWGEGFGLETVALRYFNVFGPRQADDSPYTGVIAIFARALLEGRAPVIFGDGGQTRDFTFIGNVVDANLRAMDRTLDPGVVINVGSGDRISLNELLAAMQEEYGTSLVPTFEDPRGGDVRDSLADVGRARELLGYEPLVDWRTGLKETLAWYRERTA
jgi:UDP-glucose 4-epimerase